MYIFMLVCLLVSENNVISFSFFVASIIEHLFCAVSACAAAAAAACLGLDHQKFFHCSLNVIHRCTSVNRTIDSLVASTFTSRRHWQMVLTFSFLCFLFQLSAVLLPGNHVVMVTVTSGLGNVSAALNVSVLRPITIRRTTVRPVTLGRPFVIEAVINGDPDFTVTVNYGDGHNATSSTSTPHTDIVILPLNDSFRKGSAPVYLLKVRHLYMTPDNYLVSLSVANKVSHVTNSLMAVVAAKDLRVVLTTDSSSPVASNTFVSLSASVSEEDDVSFDWTCDRCVENPLVHR